MDTLENIRTFLVVVKQGSFSAAARSQNTVPSVVTKRINQLEHKVKVPLLLRSTRNLKLTASGEKFYRRFFSLIGDIDAAINDVSKNEGTIDGRIRVKCPTTLTVLHFGDIITAFQEKHPQISIDLYLMDRSVNPIEEGFDIAIGALPHSYAEVVDIPLYPLRRVLIATPKYLEDNGVPEHPKELADHPCVTFLATGPSWYFKSASGFINVDVNSRLSVNDSQVLISAVQRNMGIGMVAKDIARPHLEAGTVVEVLPSFDVPELWVKALVPKRQKNEPAVNALIKWLEMHTYPTPAWL